VLAGLLLLPPAAAGCALGRASGPTEPDPLVALADAARADAALAAAAVAADPALAEALQPLVDARTQHAAALDAEVARLDPDRPTPAPAPRPSTRPGRAEVQRAVLASGRAAGEVALGLPPDRVGLVASVAACCGTYAEVLA
jgi:HAMP domain-containing protein